jgi:hypothetical protein
VIEGAGVIGILALAFCGEAIGRLDFCNPGHAGIENEHRPEEEIWVLWKNQIIRGMVYFRLRP